MAASDGAMDDNISIEEQWKKQYSLPENMKPSSSFINETDMVYNVQRTASLTRKVASLASRSHDPEVAC